MKEDKCGYKITRNRAFKVNMLAVATICLVEMILYLRTGLHSNLPSFWACDTLIQDFCLDHINFELR